MQVFHSSQDLPQTLRQAVVCIGNFDGVHRGHQTIIEQAKATAASQGRKVVVYTFWPHSTKLLVPRAAPKMIQTQLQKVEALSRLAIDAVIFEPFNVEFSKYSARQFFDDILCRRLQATHVYVGYDFTFGYHRQGTVKELKTWCAEVGMSLTVIDPIFINETLVSSSAIRRLLSEGEVEDAAVLLGRFYDYRGRVVTGDSRGRTIGVPTANLDGDNEMLLAEGVYAVWVECEGKRYKGVCNIGKNPTFVGDRPIHAEVHLFDFSGDLYNKTLSVQFVKCLRGEHHFKTAEELRQQIAKDCEEAKRVLLP